MANKELIDEVIVYLIAIKEFSKDIHYTCHGDAFYSKHLLVDKFNWDDHIDLLKECCLLGNAERPLSSKEYLKRAVDLIPTPELKDDKRNFETLASRLRDILTKIDEIEITNSADSNVVGNIAQDLQQYLGLINLQIL